MVRSQPNLRHDFEVVVVSYLSAAQVKQLLDTLPQSCPVALVDNAKDADGLRDLSRDRPATRYIDSGGGKGFAKAANLGARSSSYEFVIFVNPDSRPTVGDLCSLIGDLDDDSTLASSAAIMVGVDGRAELGAGGWQPSVKRALVHSLGLHKILPRAGLWARPELGRPIDVDWTTGACLAVRRGTFLRLGGFDERYYVYNEDVAYGRQAREAGLRQLLRTDVLVPHHAGSSGGGSQYMLQLRAASFMEYLRDSMSPMQRQVIRVLLTGGSAARIAFFRLARRDPRAAGHVAYVRGLWRGRPVDPVTFKDFEPSGSERPATH